jgi:sugar lactone lactonase YvrE
MSRRIKYLSVAAVLIILVVVSIALVQANADGQVEVVKSFDRSLGELPEGITIDKTGNMYVSLGLPGFAGGTSGEIWKISPDGTETVLAEFNVPPAAGLAVDAPGNVYYAHPTNDSSTGVYHLTSEGDTERLPGSGNMILPNGLAFDKQGNLYASDSIQGAIWRMPRDGSTVEEPWFQHEWLAGCGSPPFGANGVAYWQRNLYVAVTTQGLLVRIPILSDGSPGEPVIIAGEPDGSGIDCEPVFDELFGLDGIALDVHGTIYALVVLQNKLVRIDVNDGVVTTLLTEEEGLWNPASLAFGTGKSDRKSIFITNYAVLDPVPPNNLGAAILKFDVGEPGLPLP